MLTNLQYFIFMAITRYCGVHTNYYTQMFAVKPLNLIFRGQYEIIRVFSVGPTAPKQKT